MSKTIVITGITGIQGSSVANVFLDLPNWRVRGVTRNPSSPAAEALTAKGAELVKGDLDDIASLVEAFIGANVIFSNTDYFGHLFGVLFSDPSDTGVKDPLQYAYEREVSQGLNIAEAAASPEVLKTLELFILSSLSDAAKWSGGKYTHIYHQASKVDIIRGTEARFPDVAARMSTVQVGHYVTNWHTSPPMRPQKQADGSYAVRRTFSPEFEMPFVVAQRDTGQFVRALLNAPPKTNLLGASETMNFVEWTRIWGEVLGVKAIYEQVPEDAYFGDVPAAVEKELTETFRYVEEFGYTGGDPNVVTIDQLDGTISLTSMVEYIRAEDWSSVL